MRIVIDLQGAQSESRFRGIGRYSLALALGVARNAGRHEVWLLLNGALGGAIDDLRQAFAGLVPPERIRVFDGAGHSAEAYAGNSPRARAGELLREYALAQLRPDAVLVTSLFEGFVDDSLVSIGRFADGAGTAAVLYDLIPFLNPEQYLRDPEQRAYYERKVASLRRAGLLLAISDYSRQEAIDALGLEPGRVVSISTAVDDSFCPAPAEMTAQQRAEREAHVAALRARFGITRAALMCAPGGFDSRKNIDGLVAAYSMLPAAQRAAHQLVIAGKANDAERQRLADLARRHGLGPDELVFTGYVSDADLIDLYREAALFVFPSLHEGFGLPVLEAMACGALVIGADSTSIPEVIGNPEAMFDARDPGAIAAKIGQVLGDPALQARLREHNLVQRRKFSWDESARRALAALEAHAAGNARDPEPQLGPECASNAGARPRIAFLSPLPPERTGIADYAVRVLPTLLPWFDVELVTDQAEVALPPELAQLPRRPLSWLDAHPHYYRNIVYQFGNSPFHSHMLALLQRHPGVVVLHDYFLSSMLAYEQASGAMPGVWTQALLHSHGYGAVQASLGADGMERAKQDYPSNLEILQDASHVIVHSEYARSLARDWIGPDAGADWSQAQLPRAVPEVNDRAAARRALGIADDEFVVCNFGFVAPTKHCLELLDAWLASSLHHDRRCRLVFVGENHGGDYGRRITDTIAAAGAQTRVTISGWTSDEDYFRYVQAADIGVQLRTGSRGETSGTVLDCMIYGLPVIINANGAMAEFPHDAVWMLPDAFARAQLVEALETLRGDDARRLALGAAGFALMRHRNSPERVGRMYKEALDLAARKDRSGRQAVLGALLDTPGLERDDAMLQRLARSVARAPDPLQPRQLLLDVSTIARNDLKTGIERVVRKQLLELLQLRGAGYRIEPVRFSDEGGQPHYRYARNYCARLLGIDAVLQGPDPVVDVQAGDIFYCAELSPQVVLESTRAGLYAAWRARGVSINFTVHDLLPVLRPEFFPPHADRSHAAWLECVAAEADRLICVSRAVRDDLAAWLAAHNVARRPGQLLTALHSGADLEVKATASAAAAPSALAQQLAARPTFLMVGTIEPRKGHLQALEAFEQLWADGLDANLVIVGREGWTQLADAERRTLPRIVARLRASPELGRRLLWLEGLDDDALQQVYQSSSCLLFPSEGEGFGLPLIEAAQYGLPLLARDIPVFREVAGAGAHYFSGLDGASLAGAVREWLALHAEGRHPSSQAMTWMTWQEQARALLALLSAPHAAATATAAAERGQ
ncbi:glycosyltransferase [Massilia sp. YIM B02443]|uniref:glycosyltransferase n=1 Tax=Massilia sp. YIM B02443 TaxID=3050127 RepID=UPI0025B66040|nr:glycosyltransferase [Massilia sp. YIM B02443]MDN4035470.1 glycosyltransferase [Massilia sp. YIM B02443]